jgi:hypothetical protein
MVTTYKDITIRGECTKRNESEPSMTATHAIAFEIEGPQRRCLTGVNPIHADIVALEGMDVSKVCGVSTVEAVAIHIEKLILPRLNPPGQAEAPVCPGGR